MGVSSKAAVRARCVDDALAALNGYYVLAGDGLDAAVKLGEECRMSPGAKELQRTLREPLTSPAKCHAAAVRSNGPF